jgi:hypothetical protein
MVTRLCNVVKLGKRMYMCAQCEVHSLSQSECASVEFFYLFQVPKHVRINDFIDFVHRPVF